MSSTTKVKQMAHLKQKQIGDNSCKAIIIDTLLETVRPLTQEELSGEITSLFHVLVATDRLNLLINTLSRDGIILFDTEGHLEIPPTKKLNLLLLVCRKQACAKQQHCYGLIISARCKKYPAN